MVIFLFSPLLKIQQYFLNSILSHVVVLIYFWPHLEAYGISLPLPGVELQATAVKTNILTTRPPGATSGVAEEAREPLRVTGD